MGLGGKDLHYWIAKRDSARLDLAEMSDAPPIPDAGLDMHYRLRQAEAVDALQKAVAAYQTMVAISELLAKLDAPSAP